MAPRRSGGYSSGGGSSCAHCLDTFTLTGYGWQYPTVTALFATSIILLIILIVCMFLTRRFKWIRERGTDKLRNKGYICATSFMFCNILLSVIFMALGESYVTVTALIYIGYIIQDFFARVANVLIVAIIARTITDDIGTVSQKIASYAVGLLWTITTVSFGFTIAVYAEVMSLGYVESIASDGQLYTSILEASYMFAFALFLTVLAIFAVLKRSSMGTLLMLTIVMPALCLMTLLELVKQAVYNFASDPYARQSYTLSYASAFVTVFALMAIFLTVALIGGLRQRHSDASGLTQEQKLAQPGPHYVAVGPYAPPPAPYNPHGTQLADGQYDQQTQYGTPGQQGQAQPFQYTPPQHGQQQMQYAQYPAPGQFAQQPQHAEMSNTPAMGSASVTTAASPVQYAAPVAVSPASVSPPPQHDPYQMHMQQKTYQ
ncbi:hypothetical protein VC83_05810 [Pseudogymnoascus destructans]|uniref:Uncharacterized protein n=2 Tax=Pseudogymnoascus destructans TaxID=655981 RepID=L8FVG3_PSED2|nr:uncharacterized protein VC83_05810 [Pseudogymnoascus destructans]ELR03726.1 hypothetical protein GMDG_06359 [Pseudogymnoascus destructans 20631-21]OAF57126.1 hypothetical protein VC83_05810 [Pseudogymnoascus destructans]